MLSGVALAGIGVFVFAVAVLMLPHSQVIGDRLSELTCLQLAFTSERAAAVVLSFPPEAQAAIARLLIPGDVTFAWFYGLLLAGLLGLLTRRLDGAWFRAGTIAMWFPIAASVFDCIEDYFLYQIVNFIIADPAATMPAAWPLLAGVAATLKYLFLAILTPLFAVFGALRGLRTDRRIGALITYALVCLAALSMVPKLFIEAPACF